jgi:hypothetical protein
MTVGTGFFGRSSLTENLQPRDLVQWTQVAYTIDPAERFGDFSGLEPWSGMAPRPVPSPAPQPRDADAASDAGLTREELRRMIYEELREVVRS